MRERKSLVYCIQNWGPTSLDHCLLKILFLNATNQSRPLSVEDIVSEFSEQPAGSTNPSINEVDKAIKT